MSELLTQDEVDLLLEGIATDPSAAPAAPASADEPRPFDVATAEQALAARLAGLEVLDERLARGLGQALSGFLQRRITVTPLPVRVLRFDAWMRALAAPVRLDVLRLAPLQGQGLAVVAPGLVYAVIDALFGGQGRGVARTGAREFTPTEQRILQRIVDMTLAEIAKAWAGVVPLQPAWVRAETQPEFAVIAARAEAVAVASYAVDLGKVGGDIQVALPYAVLEPVREALAAIGAPERPQGEAQRVEQLVEGLHDAKVDIVARLAQVPATIQQVLAMRVGDVVEIDLPERILAYAHDVPLLECRFGLLDGRYAIAVESVLTPRRSPPSQGGPHVR